MYAVLNGIRHCLRVRAKRFLLARREFVNVTVRYRNRMRDCHQIYGIAHPIIIPMHLPGQIQQEQPVYASMSVPSGVENWKLLSGM